MEKSESEKVKRWKSEKVVCRLANRFSAFSLFHFFTILNLCRSKFAKNVSVRLWQATSFVSIARCLTLGIKNLGRTSVVCWRWFYRFL